MAEGHSFGRMCGNFQARHLTALQGLDLWCWMLTTVGGAVASNMPLTVPASFHLGRRAARM